LSEKQRFRSFLSQKVREIACFWRHFVYFEWQGGHLPPLTPSTTTPCLDTPLTNSWRTKQFLSHPRDLQLFLSEGTELLTTATA
jgi:hypothetical protein